MKTIQIYAISIFALILLACVQDDEFEIPITEPTDPDITGELITINNLTDLYGAAQADGKEIFTFEGTNTYTTGYVISSDEAGNFFEELILQDAPKEPQAGIKLLIDVNPLFTKYELGRKVFVKLDGLSVGLDSGVLTLGVGSNNAIRKIPAPSEEAFLLRGAATDTLIPAIKTLGQLSGKDFNTLIQLPNVQFTESDVGLSFANEPGDEFDGDRTVESCSDDGGTILFQTSTFSDFKELTVPDGSGSITAVLTKNFFGDVRSLVMRDPNDIHFDSQERCEPKPLDPGLKSNTTFAAVRGRFENSGGFAVFDVNEDPLIIEGYVISSDEDGNFFDEIIFQNTPGPNDLGANNPRLGLRILLDKNDSYETFPLGRRIFVKLNGLAIHKESGVLTLGIPNVSEIEKIPEGSIADFVLSAQETEALLPLVKTVRDLDADDLSTLVQLRNMQFTRTQLGFTYASELGDNFDGERQLESCDNSGDIRLFTSTFSNFKAQLLDEDSGTITAIYTRDFTDEESILVVRDLNDISFEGPRCDPPRIDCGLAAMTGGGVVFEDFFETQVIGTPIEGNGWTNYIQEGTETWEAYYADGANASLGISARMGSFNSGDENSIGWLISPKINFDTQEGETLGFKTSNSFANGSELEIMYSANWDGSPEGVILADWSEVSAAIVVSDGTFFGDWVYSGNVDVSCVEGEGYIAWKYVGSGTKGFDGTYELDDIQIKHN